MQQDYLKYDTIYRKFPLSAIIFKDRENYPIVYLNAYAKQTLNPLLVIDNIKEKTEENYLAQVMRFKDHNQEASFFNMLRTLGSVDGYATEIVTPQDDMMPVRLTANRIEGEREDTYILYISDRTEGILSSLSPAEINNVLSSVFYISSHTDNIDEAINDILEYIGKYVDVSRAYIFEDISPLYTSNTYEWCADGIEPAIQNLQYLKKADYNYDVIVQSGMYITDDVRDLPQDDREILEAQNIKSLAILSLVYHEKPIGYIGFDDCNSYRVWRKDEIALLRNVSSIIVSLMVRREAESKVLRTIDILHKITDSLNYIIYVNDIQTNEILFTNKALREVCSPDGRALEGAQCWQVLQQGEDGVCSFCPLHKMIDEHGNVIMDAYTWEFQNTVTGKWYLVNDSIIEWIDGRMVHMETALEITNRKEYEERLERYASTDMMTGLLNRITGYQIIQNVLDDTAENAGEVMSLIFIDVDGLKDVNDTYGHDAGDDAILSVVDSLRRYVRKEDMICRWGGDEFLVMLQCGQQVAAQKMGAVEEDIFIKNSLNRTPYKLAVSYGITEFVAGSGSSIDDIVNAADKKMYDAKTNKK